MRNFEVIISAHKTVPDAVTGLVTEFKKAFAGQNVTIANLFVLPELRAISKSPLAVVGQEQQQQYEQIFNVIALVVEDTEAKDMTLMGLVNSVSQSNALLERLLAITPGSRG